MLFGQSWIVWQRHISFQKNIHWEDSWACGEARKTNSIAGWGLYWSGMWETHIKISALSDLEWPEMSYCSESDSTGTWTWLSHGPGKHEDISCKNVQKVLFSFHWRTKTNVKTLKVPMKRNCPPSRSSTEHSQLQQKSVGAVLWMYKLLQTVTKACQIRHPKSMETLDLISLCLSFPTVKEG